jgi:hypothetical protein
VNTVPDSYIKCELNLKSAIEIGSLNSRHKFFFAKMPETVTVALLSLGEVRHEQLILICVEYPQVTKASNATNAVSGIFAKKFHVHEPWPVTVAHIKLLLLLAF